jgi:hypothetical protein
MLKRPTTGPVAKARNRSDGPIGQASRGRIARILTGQNHGFIKDGHGRDVFFHRSDLADGVSFNRQPLDPPHSAVTYAVTPMHIMVGMAKRVSIDLTPTPATTLRKPIRSRGGFQSLLRRLQEQRDGRHLMSPP